MTVRLRARWIVLPGSQMEGDVPAAAATAAANSCGRSSGRNAALSTYRNRTSAKNWRAGRTRRAGNGSWLGHNTVVGTVIRSAGCGARSAATLASPPTPTRYQPIDAVNAPGSAYTETRWSRWSSGRVNPGPDQCVQKWRR